MSIFTPRKPIMVARTSPMPMHIGIFRHNQLCPECRKGRHGKKHDPIMGCLQIVDPEPTDYVCECNRGGKPSS